MEQVTTTIFFDGQFWIALIEKTADDGTLAVGKHTFGAEPTNTDLLHFTLYEYSSVRLIESGASVRIKIRKSIRESDRQTGKAKRLYAALQKEYLQGKKRERSRMSEVELQEKYRMKQQKKKEKKRGH